DYLDGELPAAEREPIRAHLEVCAVCRREAALCQQSERALASALSAVPPPGDLRTDFYARLASSEQTAAARRPCLSCEVSAPALAACALAVLLLPLMPSPPTSPVPITTTVPSPDKPAAPTTLAQAPVGQFNMMSALPAPTPYLTEKIYSFPR